MHPYLHIPTLRFREVLQYRAAAWAGVFTQIVFGFIILMSLRAFMRSNPAAAPMTPDQVVAYVWLGQAFLALLPWNADRDIMAMMRNGSIGYELARPIDTYTFWFLRTLGWRTSAATLRCIPLLVIVTAVFPLVGLGEHALPTPPSLAAAAAFLAAMSVAVVLGIAITMILHVLILYTANIDGVVRIIPAFVILLSGNLIPLPMYPDWLQPVLFWQPFRGLVDVPFRIYSGHIPPEESLPHIALSVAWIVALVLLGRAIMARGFKRVVTFGG